MDIVVGPELADPAVANPFDECDPLILIGTGHLYLVEPGTTLEVDCGNFSIVSLITEGESFQYFPACLEFASATGITDVVRLELAGDSFAIIQLARMLNEPIVPTVDGDVINLETVRDLTMRRVRFVKDLDFGRCAPEDCNQLEIVLWHAHFDMPTTYALVQDEAAVHTFNLIGLADAVSHPANPFGYLKRVCPVAELS